jgi:hypothetical protein
MTINLPANVLHFATDVDMKTILESSIDFWNHHQSENSRNGQKYSYAQKDRDGKEVTLTQKSEALSEMILNYAAKKVGITDLTPATANEYQNHPTLRWAIGNIGTQIIDSILPDTVTKSTGAYASVQTVGWGETAIFDIRSRDLFTVTKASNFGKKQAQRQTQFVGQRYLTPEMHMVSVSLNLWRVLTGKNSLAEFISKALLALETEMSRDIYSAMSTAMAALSTTASTGLRAVGWNADDFISLSDKVSSWSGGANTIAVGTKIALNKIFPNDANYRYDIESDYVKLGYMRNISGINTYELPQVADFATGPFATYLNNDRVWLIAPGTDKLVKCVIGGTSMSNMDDVFTNADMSQSATMFKAYVVGVVTSSVAAEITVS